MVKYIWQGEYEGKVDTAALKNSVKNSKVFLHGPTDDCSHSVLIITTKSMEAMEKALVILQKQGYIFNAKKEFKTGVEMYK